jgi:hypothetical protein
VRGFRHTPAAVSRWSKIGRVDRPRHLRASSPTSEPHPHWEPAISRLAEPLHMCHRRLHRCHRRWCNLNFHRQWLKIGHNDLARLYVCKHRCDRTPKVGKLAAPLRLLISVGGQLPACLHRHISGCPSRHALADRALKPCHIQVVEKCENPRTGPAARASRAHGCCSKSDDSCAPVRVAASRVSPLHHARANFLPRGRRPRNSRVRHRHRRSLRRSLTPPVAARSAPQPSPPHALGPEHARHEHRMRRVRCTCMRP